MAGFDNDIMYADNVDFSGGSPVTGKVTTDGQLLIGSTATPNIKVGTLTSSGTIDIGYSDPNITVDVNGSSVGQTITGDTGGSLSPTAGNWNILGSTSAAGTTPVSTSGSGSTLTANVQISQAVASTDATKIGLSNFDSAKFSVDANGFVSVSGTGVGQTITGDTGGALSPTAGNWNILGSHGLNTSGSASTLTAAINNSITLGDLSAISAGSNALSATTGDINIAAANLKLPDTTSANAGVINFNGARFIHKFGDIRSTFIGTNAGNFTLSALNLTGIGYSTLQSNSTGGDNTACGSFSLTTVSTGSRNTALGASALRYNNGSDNTAVGSNAMLGAPTTTAINNSCLGRQALYQLSSGSYNSTLGYNSGSNYTTSESHNIIINNSGTVGESNVCRIGSGTGTGTQQLQATYISGIDGVNVGSTATIVTEASDRLGTAVLTAGTGISITPGANTITISNTSGGFPWSDVSGAFSPVAQNGYFVTGTATGTLPASPTQGQTIQFFVDHATQDLTIQASGTQIIRIGNSVSSAGGTALSNAQGDSVELVYRASNDCWCAVDLVGTWTLS